MFLEPPLTSKTLAAAAASAAGIPNPWSSFCSVSASALLVAASADTA